MNNKLNLSLYNCINNEKYINDINIIENEVKNYNIMNNLDIRFSPEEKGINYFIEKIKNFVKYIKINVHLKNVQ